MIKKLNRITTTPWITIWRIGLPKKILIIEATKTTKKAINSGFPIDVKSLVVFIANILRKPKIIVVIAKAFAIIALPPGKLRNLAKIGPSVIPLTKVNPNRTIRFIGVLSFTNEIPKSSNSSNPKKTQNIEWIRGAIPIPVYAPAVPANIEAAKSLYVSLIKATSSASERYPTPPKAVSSLWNGEELISSFLKKLFLSIISPNV